MRIRNSNLVKDEIKHKTNNGRDMIKSDLNVRLSTWLIVSKRVYQGPVDHGDKNLGSQSLAVDENSPFPETG